MKISKIGTGFRVLRNIRASALLAGALFVSEVSATVQTDIYRNDFNNYDDFASCTILDKNNDGICWDWRSNTAGGHAYCYGTTAFVTSNDWLITPPVQLEEGHSYRFIVTVRAVGNTPERLEGRYGTDYHQEDLVYPAFPAIETDSTYIEVKDIQGYRIDSQKAQSMRFGFHFISDPYSAGVEVHSMRIADLGPTSSLDPEETVVYSEAFESPTAFATMKVSDMNGDGAVWSHNNTLKCAQYTYSSANAADDWLLTPGIRLSAGRDYRLTLKASALSEPERIEVTLGHGSDPTQADTMLVAPVVIAKRTESELTCPLFRVHADGAYFIGFHAISDKDCDKLRIDDITVSDIGPNGEIGEGEILPPDGLPIPYNADMTDPAAFAGYTVFDANYDGRTWKYDPIFNTTLYSYSPENKADDWLVSPFVKLEGGKSYRLSVHAASRGTEYPEKFEAFLGKETLPAAMTLAAIPPTTVTMGVGDPEVKVSGPVIDIDADGNYAVGLHCISEANMSDLLVNRVILEEFFKDAPLGVTGLTAVADPTGLLRATISFNAPTEDYAGNTLSVPLSRITVTRGETVVAELTDVVPGQACSVMDPGNGLTEGKVQYNVVPFVGTHAGEEKQVTLYIGPDIPLKPASFQGADTGNGVALSWDEVPAKGVNGGTVYPAAVSYDIFEAVPEYTFGVITNIALNPVRTVTGTSADVEWPAISSGAQAPLHFALKARNSAGSSQAAYTSFLGGAPYELPFAESFAGAKLYSYISVDTDCSDEDSGLYLSQNAADGDDGALAFVSYEGNKYVRAYTGKIAVRDTAEPVLSFNTRNAIGTNSLSVSAITPDGAEHPLMTLHPGSEYTAESVDLSDFSDRLWVRIVFKAHFPQFVDPDHGNELNLDAIRLEDAGEVNETVVLPEGTLLYGIAFPAAEKEGDYAVGTIAQIRWNALPQPSEKPGSTALPGRVEMMGAVEGVSDFMAGTSVGETTPAYYCYHNDYDASIDRSLQYFGILTFDEPEFHEIAVEDMANSDNVTDMMDLCWNPVENVLLGLDRQYVPADETFVSTIQHISTATGRMQEVALLDRKYSAIASDGLNSYYLATVERDGTNAYRPAFYKADAAFAVSLLKGATAQSYGESSFAHSMCFLPDAGVLCLMSGRILTLCNVNTLATTSYEFDHELYGITDRFCNGTSGIIAPTLGELPNDGILYNIQGLPVSAPGPGIYIRNGRKVIIR